MTIILHKKEGDGKKKYYVGEDDLLSARAADRGERNVPRADSVARQERDVRARAFSSVSRERRGGGELVNPAYESGGIWEAAWKREAG